MPQKNALYAGKNRLKKTVSETKNRDGNALHVVIAGVVKNLSAASW